MCPADTARRTSLALVIGLSVLGLSCGVTPITGGAPENDAGEPPDASGAALDASTAADAASAPVDGGTSDLDSGSSLDAAGAPDGSAPPDAGTAPDASAASDASTAPDASAAPDESAAPDGGPVSSDGGCAEGSPCPTGNPCQAGTLACAADGGTYCSVKNVADGTTCGTDKVCLAGSCAGCVAGSPCVDAANPCRLGTTSCATGKQECANLKNAADGAPCGTGQVCSKAACAPCTDGAACQDPADLCQAGTQTCAAGPVCAKLSTAPDGTACGKDKACLAAACVCQPGGSCAGATPCQGGTIVCTGGAPTCGNVKNLPDGTTCGANQACLQGACVCQPGGSCVGADPCQTGTITCAAGAPACGNFSNAQNGTSCGTDKVCNAGKCVGCASGQPCLYAQCQLGSQSCATGTQMCANPKPAQNGTVCGTDQVCLNGACTNCKAGGSCSPNPMNSCRTGTISCASGFPSCLNVQNAANGTACGAGLICINGLCTYCAAGNRCTAPGNVCQVGTLSCGPTGPSCGNLTNAPDNSPCGLYQVCRTGKCVCANPCTNAGVSVCTGPATYQTCRMDANGCFFLAPSYCPQGQTCANGVCGCSSTCSTPGATICASPTTVQVCVKDASGCLTYRPQPAAWCPGAQPSCSGNACVCQARTAGQIFVSRNQGHDTFGNGSKSCPFRTITKGLATAASSSVAETINVAPVLAGVYGGEAYDASIGEVFPLVIPANATVQGASNLNSADEYPITGAAPTGNGQLVTVQMNGGALNGVRLRAAPWNQVQDSILVFCNAGSPSVSNCSLRRSQNAFFATGTCSAVLKGNEIADNSAGGNGTRAQVVLTGSSAVSLINNQITANTSGPGVYLNSSSATPTVFSGNLIGGNWDAGLRCSGKAVFTMQSTTVQNNGGRGVRVEDNCAANLSGGTKDPNSGCGTAANIFRCNSGRSGPDVLAGSSVPVNADLNRWDHASQPDSKDVETRNSGSITTKDSCVAPWPICP